ncbi:MAG: trigger factor [Mycoplasmatales bacterium]
MNLNVEKELDGVVKFSIELTNDEVTPFYDQAFEEEVKNVKEDGFRPGKMPKAIFMKKYGKESLNGTVIDMILNAVYPKVVEENKIDVAVMPDFDFATMQLDEENGFKVEGTVAVMPKANVDGFEEIIKSVELEEVAVADVDVDLEISKLLESKASLVLKEGEDSVFGDTAIFDFEGFIDGTPFEGGTAANHELVLGSGQFIPGFEEQLVGLQAPAQIDVEVNFPEDYHAEELKGKPAVFKCTVHEFKTKVTPELTVDVLAEITEYEAKTEEELREKVEAKLLEVKTNEAEGKRVTEIFTKIIESAGFTVAQPIIKAETDQQVEQFKRQVSQFGMDFDTYLGMMQMTEEALRADMDQQSKRKVEEIIVLDAIIENKKIVATDEEIDAKAAELATAHNITVDEVITQIGGRDRLAREVQYSNAFSLISGK